MTKLAFLGLAVAVLFFEPVCSTGAEMNTDANEAIAAAVADESRPDEDRNRDGNRKPADVLAFFGITPGMKVADLMAGGGYYSHILSRLAGPDGVVYVQNNKTALERFADRQLSARMATTELDNVVRLDRELEDLGLPEADLDVVIMVLFYHDTYWMKADRPRMNEQILASLKPGGLFGVIDHVAEAGSGDRDVSSLHRVDPETVKSEIIAAGFVLAEESDLLHNPDDDHTINVFNPDIRGQTDRFIYKFRKPDN